MTLSTARKVALKLCRQRRDRACQRICRISLCLGVVEPQAQQLLAGRILRYVFSIFDDGGRRGSLRARN